MIFEERTPSQITNRLTALREFQKIYGCGDERFSGAHTTDWPFHLRHFIAVCDDSDIPNDEWGHFLLISLHAGAIHFFMEVADSNRTEEESEGI